MDSTTGGQALTEIPVTTISFRTSDFRLTLFTTLLGFAITYFVFGMYYVEYEGLVSSFISGKLTPGFPFRSLQFIGHTGISYFYSFLYEALPNIEWISVLNCAYLIISAFIGLYLVAALLPVRFPRWAKAALQLAVFFLVFADQHIHFIYTRVAYMSCGLSLLGLIYLFNQPGSVKRHFVLFISFNLLFTIGAFSRVESATACLLLMVFFAAFYVQSVKQYILLFIYPTLVVSSITLGVTYVIKTSNEYYIQVEPDIEAQFIERKNLEPISFMKTHHDSIVYKTAANFIWSDPKVFTPQYLRSLILPENFMFTDGRQWRRVCNSIAKMAVQYWYLVAISLFLAIAVFLQYNFKNIPYGLVRWLAFELSFWALLAVQTYTVKVNDRCFLPFISLFILCHILLLIAKAPSIKLRTYVFLLLALMLFFRQMYYLKSTSNDLRTDLADYGYNLNKIKQAASGKYLVVNSSSADYLFLANPVFHPFDFSAFKKVYIVDGYILPFLPYYKRYLESECHCDIYAYPSFLNYLSTVHNQVVILSDSVRLNLTKNYLQEMYHQELPVNLERSMSLRKVQKTDDHGYFPNLQIYSLTK